MAQCKCCRRDDYGTIFNVAINCAGNLDDARTCRRCCRNASLYWCQDDTMVSQKPVDNMINGLRKMFNLK
jgi:hypothetical protein